MESLVIVSDGWKLIHNTSRPEGWSEYELFDHGNDPLNFQDVADDHPEIVSRLKEQLAGWHQAALAARIAPDEEPGGLSTEERE